MNGFIAGVYYDPDPDDEKGVIGRPAIATAVNNDKSYNRFSLIVFSESGVAGVENVPSGHRRGEFQATVVAKPKLRVEAPVESPAKI